MHMRKTSKQVFIAAMTMLGISHQKAMAQKALPYLDIKCHSVYTTNDNRKLDSDYLYAKLLIGENPFPRWEGRHEMTFNIEGLKGGLVLNLDVSSKILETYVYLRAPSGTFRKISSTHTLELTKRSYWSAFSEILSIPTERSGVRLVDMKVECHAE